MLAALLVGPRKIQLEDIEKPSCGQRTMLLGMKAAAICGTDLQIYRNANVTLPRIPGHETTGVVVDKGEDVTKFGIGDRVVLDAVTFCGRCQFCCAGKEYLCPTGGLRGRDIDGGFAEYLVVDEGDAFRLADTLSYTEATQIQTLSTVYHAQKRLHLEPGQSVLVVGLGVTGFLHVQLAKVSGATPIVVVDPFPWKLELAKELGADVAIRVPDDRAVARIREATRGHGPDAVIEAVGIPSTVALSIEAVAPGGKVLMFGIGHDPLTGFDPYLIYYKEINIIGTRAASRADWQPAINLVESGNIALKPLITHQLPLQEAQKAFALMDEGAPGLIRVVVLGVDN